MPDHSTSLSGRVAGFLHELSWDSIPDSVRRAATLRVLDILGVILAARGGSGAHAMRSVLTGWGDTGSASLIGESGTHAAPTAALMNGYLAHALDFDDTHH